MSDERDAIEQAKKSIASFVEWAKNPIERKPLSYKMKDDNESLFFVDDGRSCCLSIHGQENIVNLCKYLNRKLNKLCPSDTVSREEYERMLIWKNLEIDHFTRKLAASREEYDSLVLQNVVERRISERRERERDALQELVSASHKSLGLEVGGPKAIRAAIEKLIKERDDWHRVVTDCEKILGMSGTAESGMLSNLANVVRDMVVENKSLAARPECGDLIEKLSVRLPGGLYDRHYVLKVMEEILLPAPPADPWREPTNSDQGKRVEVSLDASFQQTFGTLIEKELVGVFKDNGVMKYLCKTEPANEIDTVWPYARIAKKAGDE